MGDHKGSYAAEFSLIVSITMYARASTILWETFIPHSIPTTIVLIFFACFYSVIAQQFPVINRTIKRLYWKYIIMSILMFQNDYGTEFDGRDFETRVFFFVLFLIIVTVFHVIELCSKAWNHGLQPRLIMQQGRVWLGLIVYFINNGIGIIGLCFISNELMRAVLVHILLGLVYAIIAEFLFLVFLLPFVSTVFRAAETEAEPDPVAWRSHLEGSGNVVLGFYHVLYLHHILHTLMEDLGPYIAEFTLIVSITTHAYASSVLLRTFNIPNLFSLLIRFFSFTRFYLLVQQLQGMNPSFKFIYWKYFLISILMLEYNGVEEGDGDSFSIFHLFVMPIFIIILLYGIIILRHGWNLEQRRAPQGMMQPVRVAWDVMIQVMIQFFNNGIEIKGMAFFSRNLKWKMVVVFVLLIFILSGLALLMFIEFSVLVIFFSLISYVSFLWLRVEIGEGGEQLDFPITIPIPFDILCFFLCHYIIVFTRVDPYVGGKVVQVFSWGFFMFSISAIFFMYYYYYYNY